MQTINSIMFRAYKRSSFSISDAGTLLSIFPSQEGKRMSIFDYLEKGTGRRLPTLHHYDFQQRSEHQHRRGQPRSWPCS